MLRVVSSAVDCDQDQDGNQESTGQSGFKIDLDLMIRQPSATPRSVGAP